MSIKKFEKCFIQVPEFMKLWDDTDLTQDDLRNLEVEIGTNYQAHAIVPGTAGLRKVRMGTENKGKSGGYRVLYLALDDYTVFLLLTMFGKSDTENLTDSQRNEIKKVVQRLKETTKKAKR